MMTFFCRILCLTILAQGAGLRPVVAGGHEGPSSPAKSIPFEQLGAEAQKQGSGQCDFIAPTASGARLQAGMQDIRGEVTQEGLWLTSYADEEGGKGNRFRVQAVEVRRGQAEDRGQKSEVRGGALQRMGVVRVAGDTAGFARPGIIEEYRVSADGVRQDFVVMQKPPGGGAAFQLELELTGVRAEAAAYGAKLVVEATGRELAYSRLLVTDAAGKELPARMHIEAANRITVEVEDALATYPVRIDPTFSDADWVSLNSGIPGANGDVRTILLDGGGNLYIGGDFTFVGKTRANGIAKWDGSNWVALGSGVSGSVRALAMIGTDLFVGGGFSSAGSDFTARRIAKWDGTAWSSITPNGIGVGINVVTSLAVSGTDLYMGGQFFSVGNVSANNVAKWDGATWSALSSGTNGDVNALLVSDGTLYAGGLFGVAGGVQAKGVAKWDGTAWSGLGAGLTGTVNALAMVGTDLYAGGGLVLISGSTQFQGIAQWNGTTWSALGSGVNSGVMGTVYALTASGSNLYVAGSFSTAGGSAANRIALWNGSAWSQIGPGGTTATGTSSTIFTVMVDGADVYCGGAFTIAGGTVAANRFAKWNGSSWSAFGSGMNDAVNAVAVMGSDLYVGGAFVMADGVGAVNRIAKWNGSTWSALGMGMSGTVNSLAVIGTDLYAGGSFANAGSVANTSYVARWNGTNWSALGTGMDSSVNVLLANGADLYAGGSFSSAGNVANTSRIAKWNGSTWSALGIGVNDTVLALAMSGSDLYAGGNFVTAGGTSALRIAKWNGGSWSAVGQGMDGTVNALAVMGPHVFVGGTFIASGSTTLNRVAKWDGSSFSPLGTGMNGTVNALVARGSILFAGGTFTTADGASAQRIASWNGSVWSRLGSGVSSTVNVLAVDAGNHLFLGGSFSWVGANTVSPFIARAILSDPTSGASLADLTLTRGTFTPPFASGTTSYTVNAGFKAFTTRVTPTVAEGSETVKVNGASVVSGSASGEIPLVVGHNAITVVVTSEDGTNTKTYALDVIRAAAGPGDPDITFDAHIDDTLDITALAVQPDGGILFGGTFLDEVAGEARDYARISANGVLDQDFGDLPVGVGSTSFVHCVLVQPDGKVIIGGRFTTVGGVTRNAIARINADGTLDAAFDPSVTDSSGSGDVDCLTMQPDGKILVGGRFTSVGGLSRSHLARLNPDGTVDPGFDPQVVGSGVSSMAVQLDGKIVVGGFFVSVNGPTSSGGLARSSLARLLPTGVVDGGYNPDPDFYVESVVLQADGKALIGGAFSDVGGIARARLARININGSLDTSFPNVPVDDFWITSLALQADGGIILAGTFNSIGGVVRHHVARVDANGVLDLVFDPDVSLDADGVALQADGKVLVGGFINSVGGLAREGMARVENGPATQTLRVTSGSRVQWLRGGTSPEASMVTFELSTNGGADWIPLGAGTRITGGWERTGLSLPMTGMIRAQARSCAGLRGGSSSLTETVISFNRAPEIAVEHFDQGDLSDGVSAIDFGSVPIDSEKFQSFLIKNVGNMPLTGVSATINGANAGDFGITTSPASTVAPGGSLLLTVRFDAFNTGTKVAALHIASDDADEPSFDIALSAQAVAPVGAVGFNVATMTVDEDLIGGVLKIPVVRRFGSYGAISVKATTSDGSAKAGTDYTAVIAGDVAFANGVMAAEVEVPIASTLAGESNETFTVILSQPQGGTRIVTPSQIQVTIIDPSARSSTTDSSPPTLPVITAPALGEDPSVYPDGEFVIRGTVTDNKGVSRVHVALDGAPFVDAALANIGGPSTTFSFPFFPSSGLHTVKVQSEDFAGRFSAVSSRTFFVMRPLVVNVDAEMGSVTAGFSPISAREAGRSYSITATPKKGKIFAGWTLGGGVGVQQIGVADSTLDKPALTFIFREGLELTAHFEDNPYDDGEVSGTYTGLVKASPHEPDRGLAGPSNEDGTAPGLATEGYLTATVMNTGAFSGKLTIDGLVLNVAGTFDHQGRARFGTTRTFTQLVARPNKPSLTVKLDIGGPPNSVVAQTGKIEGRVTATEFRKSVLASVSTVSADRAHFTGLADGMVPDEYLAVTGTVRNDGVFTVMLPPVPLGLQPQRVANVFNEKDYPQGSGVGTVRVTKAGAVMLTTTLADGTTMTAAGKLSQDLRVALFAPLYSLKGFLSTELQLDHSQSDSDVGMAAGSETLWNRPFIAASHYYPFGWAETIEVGLLGAKYVVTANQSVLKAANGVNLADADADGNATLTFTDGKVESTLVKSANLSRADAVTKAPGNDPTFTMMVNRATGAISGVFSHTDDTKPAYHAIILQKGQNAGAHGFFLTKQPVPIDYTGQSGRVTIQGQPEGP